MNHEPCRRGQEGVSANAKPLAPQRKTMKARAPNLQVQPLTYKTKGNGVSEVETSTPKGNLLLMQLARQESPYNLRRLLQSFEMLSVL